jgi:hypothetical protein
MRVDRNGEEFIANFSLIQKGRSTALQLFPENRQEFFDYGSSRPRQAAPSRAKPRQA